MYRAVALQAKREDIALERIEKVRELCHNLDLCFKAQGKEKRVFIGNEDVSSAIRTPEMDFLSRSNDQEVRAAPSEKWPERKWIAEGRDMGTVVFPDAHFKFFVTASSDVRAERRYRERIKRGEKVLRHQVRRDLAKRDEQDRTRSIAPSIPAKDAIIIDTSSTTPEQVVGIILEKMKARGGEGS
jgi:cytidylate kinase